MKKSSIKITSFDSSEGLHIAENKSWSCHLDDVEVPLCLVLEVVDMDGATGEPEYKDYPYVFSIGIMTSKPSDSFYEGTGKPSKLDLIYDCNSYMGTVPVEHKLLSLDDSNNNYLRKLKAVNAKLITSKHDFGTIAAQQGKGTKFTYPQFKTAEDAFDFGKLLIKKYGDTLMTLVGFTLDQPINMIGETGWKLIEQMHYGSNNEK